jgi:hypothetical protein
MEMIGLSENPADKSVTASVPLLAHRTAHFDPLLGCQPEAFMGHEYEIKRCAYVCDGWLANAACPHLTQTPAGLSLSKPSLFFLRCR